MCRIWSESRQADPPPHSFNLRSNAGNTPTSISQTQPLDMTLSTCTQLLWLTMARPVLSGTCPVKPLYGLDQRAAAQFWQSSYSLSYLYVEQHKSYIFFQILREFFCHEVLNFQWPVWESESDNTKFSMPAPHSHLRPCNTNESHDTRERKWLIEPNLDIFTKVCTHFCGQRFRH